MIVVSLGPQLPRLKAVQPKLRKGDFHSFKKRLSSPHNSVQVEDCINPSCAPQESCYLNASALSDPNSLHIPLTSSLVSNSEIPISTLIDSGSSHCFIDTFFCTEYKIPLQSIPPIRLKLLDGTTSESVITNKVQLLVKFPTDETLFLDFFVLPLEIGRAHV